MKNIWIDPCIARKTLKHYTLLLLMITTLLLAFSACSAQGPLPSPDQKDSLGDNQETTVEGEPFTRDTFAMDTFMQLTAYGPKGEMAVRKAIDEINRLDRLFSITSQTGDIYTLNTQGAADISEETSLLLSQSLSLNKITGGAFDCTIFPVMEIWGFPTKNYRIPEDDELDEALSLVDSEALILSGNHASFSKAGMKVDLGGIAKGYTSNRVMEIFREYGITSGIISLGGNIQTLNRKPDGSLWQILIQDPKLTHEYAGMIGVESKAVVTSGGYQRYFRDHGKTYHHIIDPATGYPSDSGLSSVTIVSSDGALADGLSTALFVMGREKATKFWQSHKEDFGMILITDDRKIFISEDLAENYVVENRNVNVIHS